MKEDKIRARLSYSFWANIVKKIDCPTRGESICNEIFKQMDERFLFNSEQQSRWDKESMDLALADFKSAWTKSDIRLFS